MVSLKTIEISEIEISWILGSILSAGHKFPFITSRLSGLHSSLLTLNKTAYFLPLNFRITFWRVFGISAEEIEEKFKPKPAGEDFPIWTRRPGCKIFEFPWLITCWIRERRFARMNFAQLIQSVKSEPLIRSSTSASCESVSKRFRGKLGKCEEIVFSKNNAKPD